VVAFDGCRLFGFPVSGPPPPRAASRIPIVAAPFLNCVANQATLRPAERGIEVDDQTSRHCHDFSGIWKLLNFVWA
jgi:hypothetical protein